MGDKVETSECLKCDKLIPKDILNKLCDACKRINEVLISTDRYINEYKIGEDNGEVQRKIN